MYQMIELQRSDTVLRGYLYLPDCVDDAVTSSSSDKKVPLAILMHGLLDSTRFPLIGDLTDTLADAGIAVLAMDFNGHGASDGKFTDMTISGEMDDARAILAYANSLPCISEIYAAGHSLGGAVASMLAAEYPESISKLFLLAPAGMVPEDIGNGFLLDAHFDPENLPDTITVFGEDTMTRSFLKDALTYDIFAKASAYPGPVYILRGDADDLVPESAMKSYLTAYENAGNLNISYEIIPNADHEFTGHTMEICRRVMTHLSR